MSALAGVGRFDSSRVRIDLTSWEPGDILGTRDGR
jgi:hypothetical protein